MRIENIVILGGTGFVGRVLLNHLVDRSGGAGGRLVVPTRRIAHGRRIQPLPTVELVECDIHDERRLGRLLEGCHAAVNLVGVLHGDEARFRQVHAELPQKLARACSAAGVRRLVHLSALGASSNAPSMYLRSKAAGEDALRKSGLAVTVLRPSVIFGAEDRFLNLFAKLQRFLPIVPLAGAFARFQPVWVDDVAEAAVRCLDRPDTVGKTIECTGPHAFTLADLVRMAGRWSGCPRPVAPLPDTLARLLARVMQWLPGEPLITRDNLESMRVPSVASGSLPGLGSLGISPAAVEAIAPLYLGRQVAGRGRLNALRSHAGRA
jgi:NADH dehydrogenase